MKFNRIILAILLFTSSAYSVHATSTGYDVELIVFEHKASNQIDSEDWSYNDMLHNAKEVAVTQNTNQDNQFVELDWLDAKLLDSIERIESNSKYNILVKKRWKQTGLDRENSYAIDINSLQEPTTNIEQGDNAESLNALVINDTMLVSEDITPYEKENEIAPSYIKGRVKLIMSRYLHFEVNLNYYQRQENSQDLNYKSYPIVSERRMRSRETHYIDHPMVGIIVHAVPYKFEPPLIENKPDDSLSIISN